MKYTFKGKTGQERKDGKKQGGQVYNLMVPEEEAMKIVKAVLGQTPGKLAQMMFSYGLTSDAQEAVGYTIPGAVGFKDGWFPEVKEWTAEDTADYILALETYAAMPREGGFSIETRQATWDTKKATLVANGLTDDGIILGILGKRPVAKAV